MDKHDRVGRRPLIGATIPAAVLVIVYGAVLVATNYLVQTQVSVLGLVLTLGLLTYPITFWMTDYTCEVYGRRQAFRLVAFGLLLSIVPSLMVATPQITFGSLLAYTLAHLHEVWAFDYWRRRTQGRHLWLRSLAAQSVSELIDTLVFTSVAFFGTLGGDRIFSIMASEYPVKLLYAVIGLGPLYGAIALARFGGWGLLALPGRTANDALTST